MPQGLGRRRLGFRIEGFGFIVSVQGWGHRVEICEYRISGFVCRIHGAGEQGAGVVGHALVPPQFRLPHITHTNKTKPQKQISSLSPQLPPPPFPPMLVHIPCREHSRRHRWPAALLLRPRHRFVPQCAEPFLHSAAQAGNTRQQQGTHHESTDARECKRHSARCGLGLSVRGEGLGLGA